MTYPPQDPAAAGGDQYGQSQPGAQPPAGGYAPGQVGGEPYPTSQAPGYGQPGMQPPGGGYGYAPGQPDPNQGYPGQPPGYPQPGYDPATGHQIPYGQYGPPPVQSSAKGTGGTTMFLVIGVVLLMAVGAFAGYFVLGEDDDAAVGAGDDDTTSENTAPEEDGEEPTDESAPAPSGTHLEVASLGSITPIPGDEWQQAGGPGGIADPLTDAEIYTVHHTDTWISFFGVGLFSGAAAVYDPTDLNASAASAAEVWLGDGFSSVEGYQMSEIEYTEVEVDGRPGVLAEWRNSWTSAPETADLYEDTAILVVDVDGVNGFIGIASVSQSGEAMYAPAVAALQATDFDAETA